MPVRVVKFNGLKFMGKSRPIRDPDFFADAESEILAGGERQDVPILRRICRPYPDVVAPTSKAMSLR